MYQKNFSELTNRLLSKVIFICLLSAALLLALILLPIFLFFICLIGLSFLTLFLVKRFAGKRAVNVTKKEKKDFTTTIEVFPIDVTKSETPKNEHGKIES